MALKELHLSIFDQTTYRQYITDLLIFPFPDISFAEDALRALRTGLSLALRHYPHLAGTVKVPDLSTGLLQATYPDPLRPDYGDIILTATYALATNAKFDYCVMEKEGFPPAMLPASAFCPLGLRNNAGMDDSYVEKGASASKGYRIPTMSVQAAFIPGGLVLSAYAHHCVVDGVAFDQFMTIWSGYVKSMGKRLDMTARSNIVPVDSSSHRRALDALLPAPSSSSELRSTESIIVPAKTPFPTVRPCPYKVAAKVLCFPASTIATLKADLQAQTSAHISTFIALTSLVYTHIIRARRPALLDAECTSVALAVVAHMGKRAGPDFPKDYSANLVSMITTEFSLADMFGKPEHDTVLTVALALTSTLSTLSPALLADRLAYFHSFPNPASCWTGTSFANGPVMMVTSWQHLGADLVWDIPGTGGGKASALRKPSYKSEGGIRILQRREGKDRDFEVLVCLEEGEMTRLVERLGDLVGRVLEG